MGNNSSKSKLERHLGEYFPPSEKFVGLFNDNNICYANSVLQALLNCRFFKTHVRSFVEHSRVT